MKAIALTDFGIPESFEEQKMTIPEIKETGTCGDVCLIHKSRRRSFTLGSDSAGANGENVSSTVSLWFPQVPTWITLSWKKTALLPFRKVFPSKRLVPYLQLH